jgi:pimeloyl-ACP methyl ester carboxylesterase
MSFSLARALGPEQSIRLAFHAPRPSRTRVESRFRVARPRPPRRSRSSHIGFERLYDPPMRAEIKSVDGTTIRCLAVGEGPPLVLVPGGLGDEHAFDPLVAQLSRRVRCITIGRRGKGFSDDAPTYSYDHEYHDVAAVADAVGPPRLLFGHSSGAICALGATLISTVDKLVLVEPPLPIDEPGIDPEYHAAVRAALKDGEAETAVLLALRHALKLEPAAIEALRSRDDWPEMLRRGVAWLRELAEINQLPADVERYRVIDAPTLLIYGTATQRRRRSAVEALGEAMPNAKVIGFTGYGHDVANAAAEGVASAVLAFLAQ